MIQFSYPAPFYTYSSSTSGYSYKVFEQGQNIITEINLPGVKKKDIEMSYSADQSSIVISIKGGTPHDIYLSRQIDPDKIESKLDLGVLKITCPILNRDKKIEIK